MKSRKSVLLLVSFLLSVLLCLSLVTVVAFGQAKASLSTKSPGFIPPRPTGPVAKPINLAAVPKIATPDDDYMKLAERVGWGGAKSVKTERDYQAKQAKEQAEFERYLNGEKIGVYDSAEVTNHMNKLTADMTTKLSEGERRFVEWEWFPLKGRSYSIVSGWTCSSASSDCRSNDGLVVWRTDSTGQGVITTISDSIESTTPVGTATAKQISYPTEHYTEPIPRDVLDLAAKIKDCYDDAEFEVTRVTVRNADPFLRVCLSNKCYVIAMWDEPGFEGKKK